MLNQGDGTFAWYGSYTAGWIPVSVAVADLDGVNGPDLALANAGDPTADPGGASSVKVLLNEGDGTFAAAGTYSPGSRPISVAIGDFDGANGPDLAVVRNSGNDVSVLLNFGDGTFATEVEYAAGISPVSVAVGELDGDNDPDLAVANAGTDDVSVLLNLCSSEPCPWDCQLEPNGEVDVSDFLALLAQWGRFGAPCDLDGGGVSVTDFLLLLAHWGPCP
jgi:hypothetical protein